MVTPTTKHFMWVARCATIENYVVFYSILIWVYAYLNVGTGIWPAPYWKSESVWTSKLDQYLWEFSKSVHPGCHNNMIAIMY